jgi:DNA polymerase type B, organellar and viral
MKENSSKGSSRYSIAKLLLNSLYGRFGMSPNKPNHLILSYKINNNSKDSMYLNNDVLNVVPFGNGNELFSYIPKINLDNNMLSSEYEEGNDSLLINVGIAASITGYSRINMSMFKDNPLFKLYYSDTDSAFVNVSLEQIFPNLVGNKLGQLKLEQEFLKAVFLAPKVYGGINKRKDSTIRIKGVNSNLSLNDLAKLLKKDTNIQIPNEKWYKNIQDGNIQIKIELYNLTIRSTKRELIYNENGILVNTQPLEIYE